MKMYDRFGGFGQGLGLCKSEIWRKHRRMLNPIFHTEMLKNRISLFDEHAKTLVKNLAEVDKSSLNILDFLQTCALGIICESIMGLNIHAEKHTALVKRSLHMITKFAKIAADRLFHPLLFFDITLYFTSHGREYLELHKERSDVLNEVLSYMKESISKKTQEAYFENENRKSFTQILLEKHLKDPSFTEENIKDEIATFLASGYDTVAYCMMWCLYLLGHHQDIQDRVFSEVETETQEHITYDDTCNLGYLECVIKESLRLYPILPMYGRHLTKDIQCGKYTIPKDTDVAFLPYALHRNADIYPDPENFIPDRFLKGNAYERQGNYAPFGLGNRDCIGKKFAMLEMKVILANIIRKFKLISLDRKEDVLVSYDLVLTPAKPLHIQLITR